MFVYFDFTGLKKIEISFIPKSFADDSFDLRISPMSFLYAVNFIPEVKIIGRYDRNGFNEKGQFDLIKL